VKKIQITPSKEEFRISLGLLTLLSLTLSVLVFAQAVPYARTYAKSKEDVDLALKEMQAYSGQKLPTLDGFVANGDKPLDRYSNPFYQFSIDLVPDATNSTIVRLTAKITAWYADRDPSKSGYQILPSNGRLELDLLDRLEERFGGKPNAAPHGQGSNPAIYTHGPALDLSGLPSKPFPSGSSTPLGISAAEMGGEEVAALHAKREAEEKRLQQLTSELQTLEQVRQNQAHPNNLVAVKKTGTPVLARASEQSHVLFMASAQDEFEFLDSEGDWIHVQISGVSRGYIRKSQLELPEFIAAGLHKTDEARTKDDLQGFRVEREETGAFPGDWETLRGKQVKIYTIQPISQDPKAIGPHARLRYATSLLQKASLELAATTPAVAGFAIIFDAPDGGIVGATMESTSQLASGGITVDDFWKKAYSDPPDMFQELKP